MKTRYEYELSNDLSKKDFLLKAVNILKEGQYSYDIFSLKFSEIKKETIKVFVIQGNAKLDFSCSVGNYVNFGGKETMVFHPMTGKVNGEEIAFYSKDIKLTDEQKAIIKQKLDAPKKKKGSLKLSPEDEKSCFLTLKETVFDNNFHCPGVRMKGLSYSGEAEIESVDIIEVPFYSCTLFYKNINIDVFGMAFEKSEVHLTGIKQLPTKNKEIALVNNQAEKIKQPNKVLTTLMIIPFIMMFVGFFLFIRDVGRNMQMMIIGGAIFGVGFLVLTIYAIILMVLKKKATMYRENTLSEHERIRQLQLNDLVESIKNIIE